MKGLDLLRANFQLRVGDEIWKKSEKEKGVEKKVRVLTSEVSMRKKKRRKFSPQGEARANRPTRESEKQGQIYGGPPWGKRKRLHEGKRKKEKVLKNRSVRGIENPRRKLGQRQGG